MSMSRATDQDGTMRSRHWIRADLMLLFVLGLSACALPPPVAYPPQGYAHTISTPVMVLYWNCAQPEAGILRLEGEAFNVWGDQPIQYLEFELAGVDSRDGTVSEAEVEARDSQIFTHQNTTFGLELRTTGREVRYDLYYQYEYQQSRMMLSGPMVAGTYPRVLGIRNLVRDACSPTQHLVK